MIRRTVMKYEDDTVLDTNDFGHGIESLRFKFFDKLGNEITANLVQAAVRATIKEVMVEVVWPQSAQVPSRFLQGGKYKFQARVRPWNLKLDRAN